jgi:DNA polymerase-3 subunit alpha
VVNEVKKVITRSGEPMLFVKVEDLSGSTELLVFPKILKEMGDIWKVGKIILAGGRVSDKDGEMKLICDEVKEITKENIKEITGRLCSISSQISGQKEDSVSVDEGKKEIKGEMIFIRLTSFDQEKVQRLKSVFFEHKGDCRVFLLVKSSDGYKKIETDYSVLLSEECSRAIEGIVGMNAIKVC